MPLYQWESNFNEVVNSFADKHKNPEASALFSWARYAVDELCYLDDLDLAFETLELAVGNHNPDIIDVAHAEWAIWSCITAFDRCAAAFGRAFCGNAGKREFAMAYFDSKGYVKKAPQYRSLLPAASLNWIDEVLGDIDYTQTKSARDSLTHSRLPRHFALTLGSDNRDRPALNIDGQRVPVRQVVKTAREVAVRHIPVVFSILPTL